MSKKTKIIIEAQAVQEGAGFLIREGKRTVRSLYVGDFIFEFPDDATLASFSRLLERLKHLK